MDIQLREGVLERTCNYVQMNCAVMGLVIKQLEKLDQDLIVRLNETVDVRQVMEAMKKSLKETNQTWAVREEEHRLVKYVKQARTALKEN